MLIETVTPSQLSYYSYCLLGYLNIFFQTRHRWNMASNQKFDAWWSRVRGGTSKDIKKKELALTSGLQTSLDAWVAQCNHSLSHFAASPSNYMTRSESKCPQNTVFETNVSLCDMCLLICMFDWSASTLFLSLPLSFSLSFSSTFSHTFGWQ